MRKISDLTKLWCFYKFSVSKSHLKFIFLSSYSIRILMSHSLTHSLSHSLSHSVTHSVTRSTKSVFKSTHTLRDHQLGHPYYSFKVILLKKWLESDLVKKHFSAEAKSASRENSRSFSCQTVSNSRSGKLSKSLTMDFSL